MSWFGPKKIKIVIRDKEIEAGVKNDFLYYLIKQGAPFIKEAIAQGKLSPNIFNEMVNIFKLEAGGALFRGINPAQYKTFLKYGNTRTPENISIVDIERLKSMGRDPALTIYADVNSSKAWEFTKDYNPSILIMYDGAQFEQDPIYHYLYHLKKGSDFKKAVKAYVLIWYA